MPGYRGRLIWPFRATIARLDTAGTLANTAGGFDEGFDHVFREPQVISGDGEPDTSARVESLVELVPCQITTDRGQGAFGNLAQMLGGNVYEFKLTLVFHYLDIESLDLVDTDGSAVFKVNDRLVGLYRNNGTLIRDFASQPLYTTEVQDRSFGLSGGERNLLAITFKHRVTSTVSTG